MQVETRQLITALNSNTLNENSTIELDDLIDLFAQIVSASSDAIDDESIRTMICRKINKFCDFDKTINKGSGLIANINTQTKTIITAIKNNDTKTIEATSVQLKKSQQQMSELEKDVFVDHLTKAYNRKYLNYKKLDETFALIESGEMCAVVIKNYQETKVEFGSIVADSVVKFVYNTINAQFKKMVNPIEIIRANDNSLVFFPKEEDLIATVNIMQELEKTVFSKNMKTNSGKIFKVNIGCHKVKYVIGDVFDEVLKNI